MSRFEELKEKMKEGGGYLSLSKEEKEEYSQLKKQEEDGDNKPAAVVKGKSGESVVLTRDELNDLLDQAAKRALSGRHVKDDKLLGKWEDYEEDDGTVKTAKIKVYREDSESEPALMVKQEFHKVVFNEETRKKDKTIYKIGLLYPDGTEKEIEMTATDYAKISEVEKVKLLDSERVPKKRVSGKVFVVPKDSGGYAVRRLDGKRNGDSGYQVPLVEIKYDETFEVETTAGQKFKIKSQYLNG